MVMHYFDIWHDIGSNLDEPKLNFLFPKMAIKLKFNGIFVLYHLPLIKTTISDQSRKRKSGLGTVIIA